MLQYDVAVVGAGPAGTAAAIAAARCGAKTLLIEKSGYPGGMGTSGLMNVWCGDSSSGLYRKIYAMTTIKKGWRKVYDPEMLKTCYLSLLEESGAAMLFHATFIRAKQSGKHLESIEVLCGTEVKTITAKIYIDATGTGFVAKSAGISYCKGRESDHLMQPVSLMFAVGGVDDERAVYPSFGTHPELEQKMQEYLEQGRIDKPAGHVILVEGYQPNTANVNMTNLIGVDGTSAEELTRAELLTRRQVPQIVAFLRDCVPGYEHCYVTQTASYVGVRETLHFEGEYKLTETDILNQEIFEDWVVSNAAFGFGNHNLTGSGSDKSNLKYHQERYTIPYRSLLAKGCDNLLLAGRNISGTHMAHASFRVMPICLGIGEGAGVAAALAAKQECPLRQINPTEIQKILIHDMGTEPPTKNLNLTMDNNQAE